MEAFAIEGDDAGRFLAAMLQGVEAEGRDRCGVRVAEDAEDAALLVEAILVQIDVIGAAKLADFVPSRDARS